ncbi:hypothetical protein GVN18_34085 [Pseudomonas sp. ODNR1LW]|nr:hypothetical protein [Pseudomonas sp. ODNR1LW]
MTPDQFKIERQTSDAAKRLARATGEGAITMTVVDHGDGLSGLAYAVHALSSREIEYACFMILSQLADERMSGAAKGCDDCTLAWGRLSSAVEALRPGFGPGWSKAETCQ